MKLYPPDSDSAYRTDLREYNQCHNPAGPGGGRFCDGGPGSDMSVSDAADASRRDERGWGPSGGKSKADADFEAYDKARTERERVSDRKLYDSPPKQKPKTAWVEPGMGTIDDRADYLNSLRGPRGRLETPTLAALASTKKWPGGYIRVEKNGETGIVYQSKPTHVTPKGGGEKHYDSIEALVRDGWVLGSTKSQGKQTRQRRINAMTKAKAKDIQTRLGRYAVNAKRESKKLLGRIRKQFK